MMRYTRRWLNALSVALLAIALSYPLLSGQVVSVKNFFQTTTGTDNVLRLDGTVKRLESGQTTAVALALMTTGLVTLDGSNPTSVNMNPLATIDGCTLTIVGSATPGDDPTQVTSVGNGTAGQLDIYAWKTDGSDPTLVASTNSSHVIAYTCGGS